MNTYADLFNSGTIDGLVTLGEGSDTCNGIGGSVSGGVRGGMGNDSEHVFDTMTALVEYAKESADCVHAGASWTRGAHFETLTQTGNGNVSGRANPRPTP